MIFVKKGNGFSPWAERKEERKRIVNAKGDEDISERTRKIRKE